MKISEVHPEEQENLDNIETTNEIMDLINQLDDDCLAQILMHLPLLQRIEIENGTTTYLSTR